MSNFSIIINSSNYNSVTNSLIYRFPIQFKAKDLQVGIQSISIYNSLPNISANYQNNFLSYKWYGTAYNLTIASGYYSMVDLNYLLQSFMLSNGHYMIDSNGAAVYFIEILANANRYSGQINNYAIPTATQATSFGWTLAASPTFSLPVTPTCPTLTLTSGFGSLLGIPAGIYGTGGVSNSTLSSSCPILSVVNSYVLTCNLINNVGISNPTNLLSTVPLTSSYGQLVTLPIGNICYSNVSNNSYDVIEVTFLDQNFNKIIIFDLDLIIMLSFITNPALQIK